MADRRRPSRVNQRLSGAASKLDDHKLLLGVVVMLVGAFLAYVAFVSTTGPPFQSRYEIKVEVPADAPPMREGQAVRIAGQLAGLVSNVEPDRRNGGAEVTANITKTAFRPIGADARAAVRVHSIVYATYLELYPGDRSDPLPSGATIEQARVSSGVDLLEVVELFDEGARRSLRQTVVNGGFGLAGRGSSLNEAAGDLGPTAAGLRRQLGAATSTEGAIERLIAGAATTANALRGVRDDDVAALIGSGGEVLGAVAGRGTELAEAIRRLRPFEDELLASAPLAEPLLDDLGETAVALEPAVAGLNDALPAVNRLLGLGGVLERETARITARTKPILRTTRPLAVEMFPTVAALDPLVPDVDRIVETITPYRRDIKLAGEGLAEATSVRFPFGQGPGAGAPAGRVIPVLSCHRARNPFPEPGAALGDREKCP
jgi:ABC-type transporter Mla subunit MlaD